MRTVIDSLVWDARFASEGLAWQQQERLRSFLRGPGLRTLQARLQAQMPADGRVLRIETLELDLGRFTPDAPLRQWAERLDSALLQALQRLPGSTRSRDAHELAQFSHYLQQGALPWSARSAQDLAGWLARLARRHGPGLWEALQRLAPGEQVLQRLALITPHGGLQALIAVRAPELAVALELLDTQWLHPLQARGRLSLYQRQRLQQALRVAGLRALWGGTTLAGPRLQGLVQALIQTHTQLLGPGWAALAAGLPRPPRPRSALARQLLRALWPDGVDERSPAVTPQQRRRSPLLAAALAQLDEALNSGRAKDGARLQRLLLGLAQQLPQELPLLLRAWAREGRRRRGWAASLAPASLGLVMHMMQAPEPAVAPSSVPSGVPSWMESLRQFALRMLARSDSPPLTLSALQQHLLDHCLQALAENGRLPQTHAGWQALWRQGWQRLQQDDTGPAVATEAPAPDWESQLDALLAAAPQRWSAAQRLQFNRLLERESDAERWLARYRPAQRWAMLNQAAGSEAATLQVCSVLLQRALQALQPQAKAAETERQHWRWLLRPLLVEGQAPRPETLVRRWAMQLHHALPQGSLARCFARLDRVLAGLSAWADPVLARLRQGLRRTPSRAEHYELGLRADRPERPLNQPPLARPDPIASDDPIYIADAGLVMLAAYAERLFGRLALLEAGRFKGPTAQSLAVAALRYLAAGHEVGNGIGSESEHVLGKLLCGVPTAQVLPPPEPLGEERCALLDALLGAVIAHWKAVGNTSIEGLRQSFLRRGGRLSRKPGDTDEQAWRLLVEPKPFDLLLDRLPWSFSTIRLPWMQGVLHVDWR